MKARDSSDRVRQSRDRVVGRGHRAVPALVRDREPETLKGLLAGLYRANDLLSVLDEGVAAVGIDAPLGVDQIAMILDEPRDPVVSATPLLAGGECHDERALRHDVLALEPEQRLGERGRAI